MMYPTLSIRGSIGSALALALSLGASPALADLGPRDMPGTEGAVSTPGAQEQDVVVEVTAAVDQLPVLLVTAATDADQALVDELRAEIELTGLYATPSARSLNLGLGLPDKTRWPALAQAAVVISRTSAGGGFPQITASVYHRADADTVVRRKLVEYPGSEASTVPLMTDAIIQDVLGTRASMSGKLIITDASTRGERAVRQLSPDGKRGRRISGFGSLARGADLGKEGLVWYASEDSTGKLELFRERQSTPVGLTLAGYVQSVSFSPNQRFAVLSMGEGTRVRTWVGPEFNQMRQLDIPAEQTALSPSVDDQGRVVHVVGAIKGPFSVFVDQKQVTPTGVWAAMPAFCSTVTEDRVVYMVRAGQSWSIRVTSLTSGQSRTVTTNGLSPACSPDGRTIAFYSPGKSGKGPGVYLVSDTGGQAHKVWSGQAAGLRWRGGEPLPPRTEESLVPPAPQQPPPAQ